MARRIFQLWFGLWTLFLGVFLPYVGMPVHYANWFWSFVDGLCLFAMMFVTGRGPTPFLLIGSLLWPLLVSAFMAWAAGRAWRMSVRARWMAGVLLLLSSALVVPLDRLSYPPFDVVPTYWVLEAVIY